MLDLKIAFQIPSTNQILIKPFSRSNTSLSSLSGRTSNWQVSLSCFRLQSYDDYVSIDPIVSLGSLSVEQYNAWPDSFAFEIVWQVLTFQSTFWNCFSHKNSKNIFGQDLTFSIWYKIFNVYYGVMHRQQKIIKYF